MSEQDRERFGFFFDQPLDGDVEFICFRCPIESASKILAECERRCLERGVVDWQSNQNRSLLFQISDHPCTVAITRDLPWEVARLSKLLNTTIATFGYGGVMIRGEFL